MTLTRNILLAGCLLVLASRTCTAQEWARQMVAETRHDFGVVARGAKVEYRFQIKNPFRDEVHIAGVRTSCGCTTPWVTKDTLKTYEQSELVAHFNTDRFSGKRGATLTVTFDRPYYAEVQLRVDGYIRSDVVLHPGGVEFGTVDAGQAAEKEVAVNYAGRHDWKILGVKSANPHVRTELREASRVGGQVSYQLKVRLGPEAPTGYINDELLLLTNDSRLSQVPLPIAAQVVPELTVSPSSLSLGTVKAGQKVTRQLVVKAKGPFRIMSIKCGDPRFSFVASDTAKAVHLIPVTFSGEGEPGMVSQTIEIETDFGGKKIANCLATARIESEQPVDNNEVSGATKLSARSNHHERRR